MHTVPVASLDPQRFAEVLDDGPLDRFQTLIADGREQMEGRVVWNVNSTATGGGVAEMLMPLIGYCRGAGVDTRWVVIEGDEDFFELTKRIHNRLHGADGDGGGLGPAEHAIYERTTGKSAAKLLALVAAGDIVVLHDPQTAGLVTPLKAAGIHVVWRCHVGLDEPNENAHEAWEFLHRYVAPADAYIFSREAFVWADLDRDKIAIIAPSIDAFSPKNVSIEPAAQDAILAMTKAKSGCIALVHPRTGRLSGILTDGDFRRSALTGPDFLGKPVSTFMTRTPKTVRDEALGVDALRLFEAYKIDDLIVVNRRGQPVGIVDGQDLPKMKIV